ncbi:non-homologous end-joining DNA ligase [Mucilaginibacter aquariorum]|uniref:DNA ligase (ATP) n=1 Tax=Mucilaginibacter aquariorum TaxID=2967225 RepID=A0ABT1TB03_9SPHI|nr:non-homologous end-joining DNA ligase [Mucilaginibacter aquariorum]MCQ6961580.1 non-homologous end-joining DNA ligase [Mucilaginibacter aquariorum]
METTPHNEIISLLKNAGRSAMPTVIEPMKATLVNTPFNASGWSYETKWDGYRALGVVLDGEAKLISRNGLTFDRFYPITTQLARWKARAVIDGEIVVLNQKGISDFAALQNWRGMANGQLVYEVFDILWYEGRNLMDLPLTGRQAVLKAVLPQAGNHVRLSEVQHDDGVGVFQSAERQGLEGIIAKKADSKYLPGIRSRDWLKIKVKRRQEVVIGGFTQKQDSPNLLSALLVGVYQNGKLRYVGKVGTGFPLELQKTLMARFRPVIVANCPFDHTVSEPSDFLPGRLGGRPIWLSPELVGEVDFAEITAEGKLRQASFKGLRSDKAAREVILEIPAETPEIIHAH